MKIELEFIDPKEGLPEEDGYYVCFVRNPLNNKVFYEELSYFEGDFIETFENVIIKRELILLWAKMPNYDEIMKKQRLENES